MERKKKKKKKTGNKPGALTVQDGIGMKECRDENLLTAIYIIRRENLTHFGAWSIPPITNEFG